MTAVAAHGSLILRVNLRDVAGKPAWLDHTALLQSFAVVGEWVGYAPGMSRAAIPPNGRVLRLLTVWETAQRAVVVCACTAAAPR
jgi:hypothetical protein